MLTKSWNDKKEKKKERCHVEENYMWQFPCLGRFSCLGSCALISAKHSLPCPASFFLAVCISTYSSTLQRITPPFPLLMINNATFHFFSLFFFTQKKFSFFSRRAQWLCFSSAFCFHLITRWRINPSHLPLYRCYRCAARHPCLPFLLAMIIS